MNGLIKFLTLTGGDIGHVNQEGAKQTMKILNDPREMIGKLNAKDILKIGFKIVKTSDYLAWKIGVLKSPKSML